MRPFGRGGRMYTRLTPTLDQINRHHPDQGSKRPNLPMPPKTHLAPRRYSFKSLVQDSLKGRGWLFASFERSLSCYLRSLSGSSRKFSASLLCSPSGEEAPDLRLSLEAEIRFTSAAYMFNIRRTFPDDNNFFIYFSTEICG